MVYTTFKLEIIPENNDIRKKFVDSTFFPSDNNGAGWRYHEADCIDVSNDNKGYLIAVTGKVEDGDELWKKIFLNGEKIWEWKSEVIIPEIPQEIITKGLAEFKIAQSYSSPDAIRIALGLKPWDEFAIESIQWYLNNFLKSNGASKTLEYIYSKRRTGQTTKMLVEAVYASQFRVVSILGWNRDHTEYLVDEAWGLCNQLGLDPSNIQPVKHGSKSHDDFVDHSKG